MATYTIGIDLGEHVDYAALAVVEHVVVARDVPFKGLLSWPACHVGYVHRWDHGTKAREIIAQTAELLRKNGIAKESVVVLDATGSGRPVVDLFEQAYHNGLFQFWPCGYVITGQRKATKNAVPKRDLVAAVRMLLESGNLKVAPGPFSELLQREMKNFRAKTLPTGHDTYEAMKDSDHDDILLATALGCWFKHTYTEPRWLGADATAKMPAGVL